MPAADAGRRLAEMGIERYVLRRSAAPDVAAADPPPDRTAPPLAAAAMPRRSAPASTAPVASVLLIADAAGPQALIEDIGRGLDRLRVTWSRAGAGDADRLSAAAGFVVLGEPLARQVAASLPTDRLGTCEWVIADPAADLARAAAAKRALWGELKRLARSLAARHGGA
ncbi:MAG TPA: hypothetical protein VMR06_02980 [Dokdonella sp.]|uniref:hypothetical protein n=1 Tax=Dokdonella sp. TaxID=2291710 RepID=UPI002B6651A6|nr:hypothetical protein [Dokdonella sp.]HUD40942.1 hypothetical protein [Dokdonella sp.]